MLVLDSELLGVLGQEILLVFLSDGVFALLLCLRRLKDVGSAHICTTWSRWFFESLRSVDGRLQLQTAWCILPDILTGEVVTSQIGSLDLVGKSLGLFVVLFILGKQRFVLLV